MNLFKTFIRSAVSQVGRDGGRVISNKVYGNRHSIPIRNVSNHGVVEVDGEVISTDFEAEPFFSNKWWHYVIALIAIPFLFWLYWLLFMGTAISYLTKKVTNIKVKRKVNVYTQDRRYRDGKRLLGQRDEIELVPVEAPKEHLTKYKIKGLFHLGISLVLLFMTILLLINWGWINL